MSIGEDIKQAYIDIGAAYTILRPDGNIEGEYGRFGNFSSGFNQIGNFTSGFNAHGAKAELPYDTQAIPGDVLWLPAANDTYLIVHTENEIIENNLILKKADLLRTNVVFSHYHLVTAGRKPDMTPDATWSLLGSGLLGCFIRNLSSGKDYMGGSQAGPVGMYEDALLFAPVYYGVETGHRVNPGAMEYMVKETEMNTYPGIVICAITEDTR